METKKVCSIVEDLLPGYVDNMTKPDTTAFVDAHLTECESCRRVCRAMSGTLPAQAVEAEKIVRKLQSVHRRKLMLRWGIVGVLLLIAAVCLLPLPRYIDVEHQGLQWRLGTPDYAEPRTVSINGTYYDYLFRRDTFSGFIRVEGYPLTDKAVLSCIIEKGHYGFCSYMGDDGMATSIGSQLMQPDGSEIMLLISEDGHWDGKGGLMLTAPSTTREEAVAMANRLAKELSAEWLGRGRTFE